MRAAPLAVALLGATTVVSARHAAVRARPGDTVGYGDIQASVEGVGEEPWLVTVGGPRPVWTVPGTQWEPRLEATVPFGEASALRVPAPVTMLAGSKGVMSRLLLRAELRAPFVVPNDPELAGSVLFFCIAAEHDTAVLSAIDAVAIRAEPRGGAVAMPRSSASTWRSAPRRPEIARVWQRFR